MLKHLGTFALLSVCLFAIAIVMGSCGEEVVIKETGAQRRVRLRFRFP